MGREIKRVPLDFDWPLKVVWKGYMSPYRWRDCPICGGSGLNAKTKALSDAWYPRQHTPPADPELRQIFEDNADFGCRLAQDECDNLVDRGRLYDLAAEWKKESPGDVRSKWIRKKNADGTDYYPPAEQVNVWAKRSFGHDALNSWICIEFRAKRLGFHGDCTLCEGTGNLWPSAEYAKLADEWKQIDPPEGPGYQLWETVSEGSPISPVFPDVEAFVSYLIGEGHTEEAARKFVEIKSVPSMLMETNEAGTTIKSNIKILG